MLNLIKLNREMFYEDTCINCSTFSFILCHFIFLIMFVHEANASSKHKPDNIKATADLRACNEDDDIQGRAVLVERQSSQGVKQVKIKVFLEGKDLPDGEHGLHIHEVASCEPCGSAGGHFDPGPNGNSSPDGNHPFHLGDLVNLKVKDGVGKLKTKTSRVTLSDGPISIFDENGSAFIIHINSDTFCPDGEQAGCAGGGRLACGIIDRENYDEKD